MENCKYCIWFGYAGNPEKCNCEASKFFDEIVGEDMVCDEFVDDAD